MIKRHMILLVLVMLFVLAGVGVVLASVESDYEISWWTVDDGGGTSSGSDYVLSGVIGQPDAGTMSGGDYALTGGFWGRMFDGIYNIYLPLVMRSG